eukprot:scaffold28_cov515-Prasinococcus_capsulatus_cf.AAC.27
MWDGCSAVCACGDPTARLRVPPPPRAACVLASPVFGRCRTTRLVAAAAPARRDTRRRRRRTRARGRSRASSARAAATAAAAAVAAAARALANRSVTGRSAAHTGRASRGGVHVQPRAPAVAAEQACVAEGEQTPARKQQRAKRRSKPAWFGTRLLGSSAGGRRFVAPALRGPTRVSFWSARTKLVRSQCSSKEVRRADVAWQRSTRGGPDARLLLGNKEAGGAILPPERARSKPYARFGSCLGSIGHSTYYAASLKAATWYSFVRARAPATNCRAASSEYPICRAKARACRAQRLHRATVRPASPPRPPPQATTAPPTTAGMVPRRLRAQRARRSCSCCSSVSKPSCRSCRRPTSSCSSRSAATAPPPTKAAATIPPVAPSAAAAATTARVRRSCSDCARRCERRSRRRRRRKVCSQRFLVLVLDAPATPTPTPLPATTAVPLLMPLLLVMTVVALVVGIGRLAAAESMAENELSMLNARNAKLLQLSKDARAKQVCG